MTDQSTEANPHGSITSKVYDVSGLKNRHTAVPRTAERIAVQHIKDRIRQAGEDRKARKMQGDWEWTKGDEAFEDGITDGFLLAFDAFMLEATRS